LRIRTEMMTHDHRSGISLEIETLDPLVEFDLLDDFSTAKSMHHGIRWSMIEQRDLPA